MTFYKTPILETERLILRPVTLADAPNLQRLFGIWDIIRYIGPVPWPYPDDGAVSFLNDVQLPAIAAGKTIGWAITRREDDTYMGAFDIRPESDDTIGFWVGKPYWQQGYTKEAAIAAYDYAFEQIGLPQLIIHNAVANTGSHALQVNTGAELIEVSDSKYPEGMLPQERWRLTPERWATSPMKRAAKSPSYKLIG